MRLYTLDPAIYVGAFIVILLCLPWWGCLEHPPRPAWQIAAATTIDYGVLLLVVRCVQSDTVGLWTGLVHIARSRRVGWANRLILVLVPILFVIYLVAVVFSLIGAFRGKKWVEEMWLQTVRSFGAID